MLRRFLFQYLFYILFYILFFLLKLQNIWSILPANLTRSTTRNSKAWNLLYGTEIPIYPVSSSLSVSTHRSSVKKAKARAQTLMTYPTKKWLYTVTVVQYKFSSASPPPPQCGGAREDAYFYTIPRCCAYFTSWLCQNRQKLTRTSMLETFTF